MRTQKIKRVVVKPLTFSLNLHIQEKKEKRRLVIDVSQDLFTRLQRLSNRRNESRTKLIILALTKYLDEVDT